MEIKPTLASQLLREQRQERAALIAALEGADPSPGVAARLHQLNGAIEALQTLVEMSTEVETHDIILCAQHNMLRDDRPDIILIRQIRIVREGLAKGHLQAIAEHTAAENDLEGPFVCFEATEAPVWLRLAVQGSANTAQFDNTNAVWTYDAVYPDHIPEPPKTADGKGAQEYGKALIA